MLRASYFTNNSTCLKYWLKWLIRAEGSGPREIQKGFFKRTLKTGQVVNSTRRRPPKLNCTQRKPHFCVTCGLKYQRIYERFSGDYCDAILELPLTFYVHKVWLYLFKKSVHARTKSLKKRQGFFSTFFLVRILTFRCAKIVVRL